MDVTASIPAPGCFASLPGILAVGQISTKFYTKPLIFSFHTEFEPQMLRSQLTSVLICKECLCLGSNEQKIFSLQICFIKGISDFK